MESPGFRYAKNPGHPSAACLPAVLPPGTTPVPEHLLNHLPSTYPDEQRSCTALGPAAKDVSVPAVRPVRVLHVITGEHYAGAERVQELLALRLPELGFEAAFACVKPGVFPEVCRARQAPVHRFPMRLRGDLRPAWAIARLVRREGFSLIHTHTVRTAMVGRLAAALARVPMVYHVHSPTSRNTTRVWLNRVGALVERFSLRGAARLITVSESLRRHMLAQGFAPEKITVVPNGVPAAGQALRRPPGEVWRLGTVALFRPRKGLEVLLEALAELKARGRQVELRAVGTFETPEYQAAILARAERLGVGRLIHWTGFARDVGAELAQMDLFVLPSLFGEGLPMVILEAMAAGLPVAATRVEGVPEAVRHGREGMLAPPGDPQALAGAIDAVISGGAEWAALSEAARRRHAERFSDQAMAAGVAAVYREVLG